MSVNIRQYEVRGRRVLEVRVSNHAEARIDRLPQGAFEMARLALAVDDSGRCKVLKNCYGYKGGIFDSAKDAVSTLIPTKVST